MQVVIEKYWQIFLNSYVGYWNYLTTEILNPNWRNYFWWLIGISLIAWLLEILLPWRKDQAVVRREFFLDGFYMFFNFFLFSLIGYNAISNVGVNLFSDFLSVFGIDNLMAVNVQSWPSLAKLLLMFILTDFIQWNTHRLLHRIPWMWEFHKVHHSVEEMGFASHFRFHWMETVIYKMIQYVPLAMIGFGLQEFFIIHIVSVAIGHLNHSNVRITYGPLKYILNNPVMHIWHHTKDIPDQHGVNFGISLSLWDYIFRTAYVPDKVRRGTLGFDKIENFPRSFWGQIIYPFKTFLNQRQGQ